MTLVEQITQDLSEKFDSSIGKGLEADLKNILKLEKALKKQNRDAEIAIKAMQSYTEMTVKSLRRQGKFSKGLVRKLNVAIKNHQKGMSKTLSGEVSSWMLDIEYIRAVLPTLYTAMGM